MNARPPWLAALVIALSCPATAQVAILQIQVVEGEGAVHPPGSRSSRPLTVEITDETGKPVPGAAVSFHLPEDGPGGAFVNGLRTEVATTDAHGRASLHGLQLNRISGRFQIRIMVSKEQARAGTVSSQYITGNSQPLSAPDRSAADRSAEAAHSAATAPAASGSHRRGKWIAAAAVVGGGAILGILAAVRSGSAAPPVSPTVTIGPPSITVGKP